MADLQNLAISRRTLGIFLKNAVNVATRTPEKFQRIGIGLRNRQQQQRGGCQKYQASHGFS